MTTIISIALLTIIVQQLKTLKSEIKFKIERNWLPLPIQFQKMWFYWLLNNSMNTWIVGAQKHRANTSIIII